MTTTVRVLAVITVSIGLAVPAVAASGSAPKPCSLLTEDQAADVLGEPVEDGKAAKAAGAREGEWRAREEGTGGIEGSTLALEVIVYSGKRARAGFDELVRDQDNEIIDGIGDEAVADDTFEVPVSARVGKQIFEVSIANYDTSNWDGDPREIAVEGAMLVAEKLAEGQDEPEPVEQPADVLDRFADDIPVPESFMSRTAFGTEYDGGGAFGGDVTIDEVIAFYEQQLPGTGYEMGEVTTEDVDGVPTTIIPFSREDRSGQVEVSPNDDPPGATLLFITYEEVS